MFKGHTEIELAYETTPISISISISISTSTKLFHLPPTPPTPNLNTRELTRIGSATII